TDVFSSCHGRVCEPRGRSNQGRGVFLKGSRMPGTISSRTASSPAAASAASASRACCSRSARSWSISAARSPSNRVSVGGGAPALLGRPVHFQPVIGVFLPLLDFLGRKFARADRIAAGELGRRGVVGDRLDLENVQTAEFGDLLKCERRIFDQP